MDSDILLLTNSIARITCRQKLEATPEAGSALIVSLCAANANERAYRVYQDMMLFAEGVSTQVWFLVGHRTLSHVLYDFWPGSWRFRAVSAILVQDDGFCLPHDLILVNTAVIILSSDFIFC